jgi:hypothetical protein
VRPTLSGDIVESGAGDDLNYVMCAVRNNISRIVLLSARAPIDIPGNVRKSMYCFSAQHITITRE